MKVIKTASYDKIASKWRDVPGSIQISSSELEGDLGDSILQKLPENDKSDYMVTIEFSSTGYDDPGSMYGGKDHLGWAPEGEDTREITQINIDTATMIYPIPPNDPLFVTISSALQDRVDQVELEGGEESGDRF